MLIYYRHKKFLLISAGNGEVVGSNPTVHQWGEYSSVGRALINTFRLYNKLN